ncbi:MAG: NUDIX hydrolase [Flavobacteriaceae bacterium]|nr:MAG: NUDIX hydrolase [Flavobacteriaceae bacterium]
MYKVFVNERPLIFTNNKKDVGLNYCDYDMSMNFKDIVSLLGKSKLTEQCVYHADISLMWSAFKASFKIERAAGGVVFNKKEEVLFIYRFGKWDLPKGHIEKGEGKKEAAIREVEEECGISALEIVKKLPTTYHMFERNGQMVLKITHWYQMFSSDQGPLVGQEEEGIELVCFKAKEAQDIALENSYKNIVLLLQSCEDLK